DASTLADGNWIRIGDGSAAEYVQLDGAPAGENTLVPVHLPLSRTHAAGDTVDQFDRALATGGPFTIVADAQAGLAKGAQTIVVEGATADITLLAGTPNQLLELGGQNLGEYRFAVGVSNVAVVSAANSRATVRLDGPLSLPYANG